MGPSLLNSLNNGVGEFRLDLGCVAAHGYFSLNSQTSTYDVFAEMKPATAFLFKLISQLQTCATVPMIDINVYSQWL